MSVEVRVTSVLQRVVGAKSVAGEGKTVGELLEDINAQYPGFKEQITQADGSLHRFVNIYINDEDIRFLQSLDTPVKEGDVALDPAGAGGRIRNMEREQGTGGAVGNSCRSCSRFLPEAEVTLYRPPGRHRQHAAGGAAEPQPFAGRALLRQAGGPEPHRQRQGPHRQAT